MNFPSFKGGKTKNSLRIEKYVVKSIHSKTNADFTEFFLQNQSSEAKIDNILILHKIIFIFLTGVARFYKSKKNHVITTQTEHKCVLDSCRQLEHEGFEVTYLPVGTNGRVDIEEFKDAIKPTTALASVMTVNNEIGVIQPIKELGEICRKNKVFFHTDAAQAVGKIPMDVNDMKIDLMSISGHKVYGPKG